MSFFVSSINTVLKENTRIRNYRRGQVYEIRKRYLKDLNKPSLKDKKRTTEEKRRIWEQIKKDVKRERTITFWSWFVSGIITLIIMYYLISILGIIGDKFPG
ncbi:MAG: hypothetical protein GC181_11225 [Bacteroidetes bacterium]|nr:hypothetical protein [Bacteroidota bacterium]